MLSVFCMLEGGTQTLAHHRMLIGEDHTQLRQWHIVLPAPKPDAVTLFSCRKGMNSRSLAEKADFGVSVSSTMPVGVCEARETRHKLRRHAKEREWNAQNIGFRYWSGAAAL
ncbi:MAG: hypothetical protein IOC58_05900 [Methylobacterium sp.]|nr:hypothetical protein [Methylobacterium sp.]